jgi:hypothetical protein
VSLLTSLISWWSFNEASGTRNDSHGTNHLSDVNTVASATGKVGNAADFESGSSERLTIVDNASLSTGNIDFTLAGWVNMESKTAFGSICMKGPGHHSNTEWLLDYISSSDRFRFLVSNGSAFSTTLLSNNHGSPSTGTWYYIVAWHDATANTCNIQINNGTADSTAYSNGSFDSGSGVFFGTNGDGAGPYDGLMDEWAFWKRTLTTDEKTWLYNGGNGRSYSEVLGHRPTASRLIIPNLIGGSLVG